MINRRALFALIGALVVAPLPAEAQQVGRVYRIGWLSTGSPATHGALLSAFKDGLRERGLVEGQNVVIEYRWADAALERLPTLAAELVGLKPDVIVTAPASSGVIVKRLTSTIPIVLATSGDPVAAGLVESLSRPGGNVTGLSNISVNLVAKQLEFLKALLPAADNVAILINTANSPLGPSERSDAVAAAKSLGLQTQFFEVHSREDVDRVFAEIGRSRVDALLVTSDPVLYAVRAKILANAATVHLPAIYGLREYVEGGGLMSYGVSLPGSFRQAAGYVDKILRGARPGDLAIEQPTKLEFAINDRTAKALGLTMPQSLLLRADEVIQ